MIICLYVDKSEKSRQTAKKVLEENTDIQVDVCSSPIEAMEIMRKFKYDIIISEYTLPIFTGIEFMRMVQLEFKGTPFILFSAKKSDIRGSKSGFSPIKPELYLPKKGDDPYLELLRLIRMEYRIKQKMQFFNSTDTTG